MVGVGFVTSMCVFRIRLIRRCNVGNRIMCAAQAGGKEIIIDVVSF